MKTKIGIGIIIFLQIIILVLLEVPDTISSYWDVIHKNTLENTPVQNLDNTQTTVGIHIDEPVIWGESIDVLGLPHKIDSWNLLEEDWRWFLTDTDGVVKRPLLYNGHDVSFARLSPSHKKLGFFFRPEDHSLGEIVLAVLDVDKKIVKEIYRGNTRTSNWEWKGDEAVIIKHSCGTECMLAYVIDISTGKEIDKYRVY